MDVSEHVVLRAKQLYQSFTTTDPQAVQPKKLQSMIDFLRGRLKDSVMALYASEYRSQVAENNVRSGMCIL